MRNSGLYIAACVAVLLSAAHGQRGDGDRPAPADSARLVTGAPGQLQAVVAGTPPTAVLKVVPVAAKVGSYPAGTTILGNELKAFSAGFRAWFEFKLSDWDPNADNNPPLSIWQIKIATSGFADSDAPGDQPDLAPPVISCSTNPTCVAAFGESWAKCDSGTCKAAYLDFTGTGRPDSWCADTGSGSCSIGDCATTLGSFYGCFGIYAEDVARPDGGMEYYGGTMVLDVPVGAVGKYTVNLVTDETFILDTASPNNDIPTLSKTGFVVNIVAPSVQACCLQAGGCMDLDSTQCAGDGNTPQGEGTTCSTIQCPAPTGACCDRGASSCTDGVLEADCSPPLEWTGSTLCVDLPDPCLAAGACCDSSPGGGGACADGVFQVQCTGTYLTWTAGSACSEVTCQEVVGACCDPSPGAGGACTDGVIQGQCTGPQQVWTEGESCANLACEEVRGSCCNRPTAECTENVLQAECQGAGFVWRQGASCSVCAPGPQLLVTPVPAKVGSYPPGTTIMENEIILPEGAGPTRIWCEAQLRNWDPDEDGNPPLWLWQIALDETRLQGVNADPPQPGLDIALASVPCATDDTCVDAFGESWAKCEVGNGACKAGYADKAGTGRPDSWCRDTGGGACAQADADVLPPEYRFFALYPFGVPRPDEGITYYGGTLVLDVPAGLTGRFTIPLIDSETFMADTASTEIPSFSETGFVVSVGSTPPPLPLWDCPQGDIGSDDCVARSRALTFKITPPAAATGGAGTPAIKITMADLMTPDPPNEPCCQPPDFSHYEAATCTAAGEGASCARWVGPPFSYLEAVDLPLNGNYRASRLQCTPFYYDWSSEPNTGEVNVVGAEILPSSTYNLTIYAASCKGVEDTCTNVFDGGEIKTRRAGDISSVYAPAGPGQPNAIDIANVVNHFKKLLGSPKHIEAQVQPNVPNLNSDVDALDCGAIVNNVKLGAYPFLGPCPCPSTVPCIATACSNAGACTSLYGANATCVRTCASGPRIGQPCSHNRHCGMCAGGPLPGIPCDADAQCQSGGTCTMGTCAAGGFCRDGCGRCN